MSMYLIHRVIFFFFFLFHKAEVPFQNNLFMRELKKVHYEAVQR